MEHGDGTATAVPPPPAVVEEATATAAASEMAAVPSRSATPDVPSRPPSRTRAVRFHRVTPAVSAHTETEAATATAGAHEAHAAAAAVDADWRPAPPAQPTHQLQPEQPVHLEADAIAAGQGTSPQATSPLLSQSPLWPPGSPQQQSLSPLAPAADHTIPAHDTALWGASSTLADMSALAALASPVASPSGNSTPGAARQRPHQRGRSTHRENSASPTPPRVNIPQPQFASPIRRSPSDRHSSGSTSSIAQALRRAALTADDVPSPSSVRSESHSGAARAGVASPRLNSTLMSATASTKAKTTPPTHRRSATGLSSPVTLRRPTTTTAVARGKSFFPTGTGSSTPSHQRSQAGSALSGTELDDLWLEVSKLRRRDGENTAAITLLREKVAALSLELSVKEHALDAKICECEAAQSEMYALSQRIAYMQVDANFEHWERESGEAVNGTNAAGRHPSALLSPLPPMPEAPPTDVPLPRSALSTYQAHVPQLQDLVDGNAVALAASRDAALQASIEAARAKVERDLLAGLIKDPRNAALLAQARASDDELVLDMTHQQKQQRVSEAAAYQAAVADIAARRAELLAAQIALVRDRTLLADTEVAARRASMRLEYLREQLNAQSPSGSSAMLQEDLQQTVQDQDALAEQAQLLHERLATGDNATKLLEAVLNTDLAQFHRTHTLRSQQQTRTAANELAQEETRTDRVVAAAQLKSTAHEARQDELQLHLLRLQHSLHSHELSQSREDAAEATRRLIEQEQECAMLRHALDEQSLTSPVAADSFNNEASSLATANRQADDATQRADQLEEILALRERELLDLQSQSHMRVEVAEATDAHWQHQLHEQAGQLTRIQAENDRLISLLEQARRESSHVAPDNREREAPIVAPIRAPLADQPKQASLPPPSQPQELQQPQLRQQPQELQQSQQAQPQPTQQPQLPPQPQQPQQPLQQAQPHTQVHAPEQIVRQEDQSGRLKLVELDSPVVASINGFVATSTPALSGGMAAAPIPLHSNWQASSTPRSGLGMSYSALLSTPTSTFTPAQHTRATPVAPSHHSAFAQYPPPFDASQSTPSLASTRSLSASYGPSSSLALTMQQQPLAAAPLGWPQSRGVTPPVLVPAPAYSPLLSNSFFPVASSAPIPLSSSATREEKIVDLTVAQGCNLLKDQTWSNNRGTTAMTTHRALHTDTVISKEPQSSPRMDVQQKLAHMQKLNTKIALLQNQQTLMAQDVGGFATNDLPTRRSDSPAQPPAAAPVVPIATAAPLAATTNGTTTSSRKSVAPVATTVRASSTKKSAVPVRVSRSSRPASISSLAPSDSTPSSRSSSRKRAPSVSSQTTPSASPFTMESITPVSVTPATQQTPRQAAHDAAPFQQQLLQDPPARSRAQVAPGPNVSRGTPVPLSLALLRTRDDEESSDARDFALFQQPHPQPLASRHEAQRQQKPRQAQMNQQNQRNLQLFNESPLLQQRAAPSPQVQSQPTSSQPPQSHHSQPVWSSSVPVVYEPPAPIGGGGGGSYLAMSRASSIHPAPPRATSTSRHASPAPRRTASVPTSSPPTNLSHLYSPSSPRATVSGPEHEQLREMRAREAALQQIKREQTNMIRAPRQQISVGVVAAHK